MSCKKVISFLALFLIHQAGGVTLDSTAYQHDAKKWKNKYLVNGSGLTSSDLQYIANLFYFSLLRSVATLAAQEAAVPALDTMWRGWQNIAQTRMNPSHSLPYPLNYHEQQQTYDFFIQAQQIHRSGGLTYAHASQVVVKENVVSADALSAVQEVRQNARTVIMEAFLDIKKILGAAYNFASEHLREESLYKDDENLRWDLVDTIISYIPKLASQSFIEAEKIQTQASEKSWEIIQNIIEVNTQIWNAVETARASYYLAYYREIIQFMYEQAIDTNYLLVAFNENGITPTQERDELLPLV